MGGITLSNLARSYQTQPIETSAQPKPKRLREGRTSVITPGEKILLAAFAIMFCFFAVKIVSNEASIYQVNRELQVAEGVIDKQEKANTDLKIQVSELSAYDRILDKAKELGLNLKDKNVKVVEE